MAFQLAYGEDHVLVSALTIAIEQYEKRLADSRLSVLHAETQAQLTVARDMLNRLIGY